MRLFLELKRDAISIGRVITDAAKGKHVVKKRRTKKASTTSHQTKQRGGKRKGAGRPPQEEPHENRTFRLPTRLINDLAKCAQKLSVSMNEVVAISLNLAIPKLTKSRKASVADLPDLITCKHCGHKWRTKAEKPRCSKCMKYITTKLKS